MRASIIHPNRAGRSLLAVLAAAALAACGETGGITPPPTQRIAALQVVSRDPQPGVAGQRLPEVVRVRVVDQAGKGLEGVSVRFEATAGGGSFLPTDNTDADGFASAVWTLGPEGPQSATASVHGLSGVPLAARIVPVPAPAAPMLGQLAAYLASAAEYLEAGLPRNPHVAAQLQSKLAILRTPGLAGDIVDQHRYVQRDVASRSGRSVALTTVFPVEGMREEAGYAISLAERAIPLLEDYLETPYAGTFFSIWYGFVVGSSTGGSVMQAEDRTTYDARRTPLMGPYEAIIIHEVSHAWMSHESLNQFLELYAYNVMTAGSADVRDWTFTRGWVPGAAENEGVHALLDIYQLIGPEAMAAAYRAVMVLQPRYGQPLTAAARDAFVAAVPAAAREQVAARLAKVAA